MLNTDLIYAVR